MNFETSFLKLIEFLSKYLTDLKNFNGQTLGSFKRSYPEQYEILKNFLNKEIFIEDLVENLIRLISHFDSNVLAKEPNFYTNKKYDILFQLIDTMSKDDSVIHNHKLSFCEIYVFKNFKSKFLSFFNNSENQTNSQQNIQINNSSVESSTNLSINKNVANAEFYRVNNQIRNIYKNKIWTNFTVSMFNRHLEKGTTPSALFFDKFPRPFLSRDKDFVKEYNEIIEKAQKEIMNLCIKYLSNRIDTMDTDLKNIHEKLRPYFEKDELDSKFDEIESREEYHLRPKMKKSMEKVNRIYAKKFEVLETVNNSDSNISNVSQNNFERSTNGSNRSTNFAGFNRSNVKFTNRYNDYRKRNDKFFSSRSSSKNRFYNSSNNSSLSNLSFNQRNIGRFSRGSSKDRTTNVNTNHRQRFSNSNQYFPKNAFRKPNY